MKILYTLLASVFLYTGSIQGQCKPTEKKMLVLGDSWAFFSWSFNSYNENFNRFGLSDMDALSSQTLSVNGSKASNWFTDPNRMTALRTALNDNPSIEYIHFSLGGNDVLGGWTNTNTQAQNTALYNTLMQDIKKGVDSVLSINSNLKILIAGYDYPNFEETILNFAIPSQHPFYNKWQGMGAPTAQELNAALIDVTNRLIDSSNVWNNVYFVNNLGLMQNTYGQDTPLTVAPYGTYQAGSLTVPWGLPNYPSPTQALNFNGTDSFHLSDDGFNTFIRRHFKEFYWKQIRNADSTILASDSSLNGTISSSSFASDSLSVGSDHKGMLSFNTNGLRTDTNILKASIFIQREKLMGSNLIDEQLVLEIKSGYFGDSLTLDANDWISNADASGNACTYGTVDEDGSWLRIDLPESMLAYINKTGTTQFRIAYPTASTNNYFSFSNSGNDNYTKAKLDVVYGGYASISKINNNGNLSIYPNPSHGIVNLTATANIDKIIVLNLKGQIISSVSNINSTKTTLDLGGFSKGIYFVKVLTKDGSLLVDKLVVE